jgi:transposase
MRAWRTREELIHQAVALRMQGMKQRAIARALGVSRNTVRKLLRRHYQERVERHEALAPPPVRAPRPTKLDDHRERIAKLVARFDDITAQRVFEEIKQTGYAGSYERVKVYLRTIRPAAHPEPSQLRHTYEGLGEDAATFFAGLRSHLGRLAGYHARQILLLRERYATDDLVRAFRHAQAYGAYEHRAVGRILAVHSRPRCLAEYIADDAARRFESTLGPDLTCPRNPDEYDTLPVASSATRKESPCRNMNDPSDLQLPRSSRIGSNDTSTSSD